MACCVIGVLLMAHALAVWRWFSMHGRRLLRGLLVGLLLTSGIALSASGVASMWTAEQTTGIGADFLDLCLGR